MFSNPTHGYSNLDTAKKCFDENICRFIDKEKEPHLYNLYNGLYNMAAAMEAIQRDVEQIKVHLASRP